MRMLLIAVITILLVSEVTFSQSYSDILFPNKSLTKRAKIDTKELLVSLSDSLDLSQKEIRIRKFKLTVCEEIYDYLKSDMFLSAEPFLNLNSCSGVYTFKHKTHRKGSHRLFTFYFDLEGKAIKYDQKWMMVNY